MSGGFLGVDLFFALSGYLITDQLLREVSVTGEVSLVGFWGRRVRRLLPALVVLLVGVTLVVFVCGSADVVRSTLSDGPWVQADLVNWHLLSVGASYWDRFGDTRVFEHLWSIAVEEQFYLVWPVVVLLLARRLPWVAGVASLGSLLLMILLVDPADPTRVYTGTDTRAFSLLLGALVATEPVRDFAGRLWMRWLGMVLLAGMLAAWVFVDGQNSPWLYRGGLFLHSLVAALLVASCVLAPDALASKVLAWPALRWVGTISYSLYLWHWPVFALLSHGWVGWVVSVGLAASSRYLVEDPVRFRAGWARGRRGVVVFSLVMVGLALFWVVLPSPPGAVVDISRLGMFVAR